MASLAFSAEGKLQAIRGGAVPVALNLMRDRDDRVRASAAAAMMGIVTDDSGKEAVIEAGVGALVACLEDDSVLVTLNTLKVRWYTTQHRPDAPCCHARRLTAVVVA